MPKSNRTPDAEPSAGIPIIEWVTCGQLAEDRITTFLFLALPLTIRGVSGWMIRPVAIA